MSRPVTFKFRLYVAGGAVNSVRALNNLNEICRAHLPERHEIEVVDVFRDPERALADGILMTPTLISLMPPVRRIVGTLSDPGPVLQTLGLGGATA